MLTLLRRSVSKNFSCQDLQSIINLIDLFKHLSQILDINSPLVIWGCHIMLRFVKSNAGKLLHFIISQLVRAVGLVNLSGRISLYGPLNLKVSFLAPD